MNYIKLLLLILISTNIPASEQITMQWLKSKPRTIAKDFYIWQYLDQDITAQQAIDALGQARNVNWKLLYRYANKLNDPDTSKVIKCKKAKGVNLVDQDASCIEIGMSTYTATKLNSSQLDIVINKTKDIYHDSARRFEILNATIPFTKLISSNQKVFFATFNQCGSKYRIKNFNYLLPKSTIKRLIDKKQFETTIKLIVTTPQLDKLQKSILNLDTSKLSHLSIFYLALNAINHQKEDLALQYLQKANKKVYYQFDKDKILFWQYQLTKDDQYLTKLSKSWDINIYSLYGMELKNIKPKNIFYTITQDDSKNVIFNTSSPFSWIPILNKSRKISKEQFEKYNNIFTKPDTLPHLAFISERYFKYKNSYFITPYEDILEGENNKRKALIYAIARQESRFIPTSISPAYAMGAMQIMPFLSKSIAQDLKEFYNIDDQLDPKTNVRYANYHLNFLERKLKHPLLIAYAYNGGIGFVKNIVLKRYFKNNTYDPYLSMEMLPYNETRKYGKKVLANYYIYANYLGYSISIKELFDSLNCNIK
jgi:soluble lytic murein transglycosylase